MFCPQCGTEVSAQASFCNNCGRPMSQKPADSNVTTMATDRPVPPVMRPTPTPVTPVQPNASQPFATPVVPHPNSNPIPPHPNASISNGSIGNQGMTYGQFVLAFILFSIPIVNIILIIKWGFLSAPTSTHKNFARALLTFALISLIFMLLFSLFGGGLFLNMF
jgi:hypothetical protein